MKTFVVIGLVQGSVYGLVALGLALVYKGARVFNFAQGEFGTVAAFAAWILIEQRGLPYPVGVAGALAAAVLMGLLMERVIVRPLFQAPRITLLVATAGVALLAIAVEVVLGEAQGRILTPALGGTGLRVFDVEVEPQQLVIVFALMSIAAAMAWFFSKTNTGLAILGMAQEPMATRLAGIRIRRMSSVVWGLAAFLGGSAGILLAPLDAFFPGQVTRVALLPGFTAAVLGGITSLGGALVGGLVVGVVQGLAQYYIGEKIPGGGDLVVFLVLLGVLLFRPQGLLGSKTSDSETAEVRGSQGAGGGRTAYRPSRHSWILRRAILGTLVALLLLVPRLFPSFRSDQISLAIIFAIIGLSIHVLMGYAGQISLGHQAFVGIGAFTSAILVTERGFSFWIALAAAAATGAGAAALLGLVALRLKGLYLALITLAYGTVAQFSIFGIRELTRGGAGMPAPRPAGFTSDYGYTYLCFGFLALVLYLDWRFVRSKAGRAVLAIRQNEMVAASYGIDVTRYKVFAFVMAGIFAGIAGSLFAHWRQIVVPVDFNFEIALTFVLMTVVGGLGSRTGVVIGSMFFALFPLIFNTLTVKVPLIGAGLLLFTLVRNPGGLGESLQPIVRYFKGQLPGKFAWIAVIGLVGTLFVFAAVLSTFATDEYRPVFMLLVALALVTVATRLPGKVLARGRIKGESLVRPVQGLSLCAVGAAIAFSAVASFWWPVVLCAVGVPLYRTAEGMAHKLLAAAAPHVAQTEELRGAA